ncbi:Crp/Fnr family transcriptional regulator [Flavobacterium seoulense]|uniref:Cyclic nucleotide-binding protein n=1 Tax=Flavobacterium seoulense TaxID=1492738 RepID=A0A066WVB4_9FLAO|nr:Crp/Fnr family transcriptional regulator [Flavobacterium seoulense]KDN54859.1 cyclic nucleotide-binding protein [Flavobacterium seoulense]
MYEQLIQFIKNKVAIADEDLEIILPFFKPLAVQKNELLVHHDELGQQMYFVKKGCLRIFFINEEGQESTRFLAFENHFASALVSFITESPAVEYVQALEDSELLYINRKDFFYLLEKYPVWEQFYRHYLEFAYVTNTNRLMSFITMDAKTRYENLLKERPIVIQRLPNKVVASYLNISQETLSRLKSRK